MDNSILNDIKKLLGVPEDYDHFDTDIIIHINSIFMVLNQLGVGPSKPFTIKDSTSVWGDFLSEDDNLESVKSYIYMRVRLLFDPPESSGLIDSMNKMISEFEWRQYIEAENKIQNGGE